MRTFLVAVVAPSEDAVMDFLAASPLGPESEEREIDCWWIAEDDRHDGSDCDSAIFVPRGSQDDMRHVLNNHFEYHNEEWTEDGYPYADTDVSGVWFEPRYQHPADRGRPTDEEVIRAGALWFLHGADDVSPDDVTRLRMALDLCAWCDKELDGDTCPNAGDPAICGECCNEAGGCCG